MSGRTIPEFTDPEDVFKQNRAMRALIAALESSMAILTDKGREYQEAITTLDSERAANARLTAEIEALSTPCVGGLDMGDGWQSIETAPKDGTPLLLSGPLDGPHDYRVKVGGWHAGGSRWYIFGASWSPTHWRPLPAPPLGKDEQ